jgi:hypothetical protein
LLRKAEITVEVQDVTATLRRLGQVLISLGGHMADRSERHNEYGG